MLWAFPQESLQKVAEDKWIMDVFSWLRERANVTQKREEKYLGA